MSDLHPAEFDWLVAASGTFGDEAADEMHEACLKWRERNANCKMTKIPGIKGKHRIINDNCLAQHGANEAARIAIEDARQYLLDTILAWKHKPGTKFHVVVTVERPTE